MIASAYHSWDRHIVNAIHPDSADLQLRVVVVAAAALLSAACVPTGLPETVLPPEVRYACRDGTILQVNRAPDGRSAIAVVGGRSVRLSRTDSAAQEKYTDGASTLYLNGDNALFTSDSFVVAGPCTATVPLPMTRPALPQPS
jgi:membrane-bound inhibitor of C-type lysozyme